MLMPDLNTALVAHFVFSWRRVRAARQESLLLVVPAARACSLALQAASKLEPLQALVLFISLGAMLRGLLLWSSLDPQMWARRWPSWRAMYVAVSSQLLLGV
jgi:hypothetical protein